MKTKSDILKRTLYILIPLAILAIGVIKLKKNKELTQSKVYQYDKKLAVNIQADTVQIDRVDARFSYSGTFEPNKETKISAEIQGKINEVLVDVGSFVNKGQALIQLDNSLLKLQLQTIELQIEGLEADVNRYSILAKADAIQGVQLEKAVIGLKSARVQMATLLVQIGKTTIRAPFGGLVTAKLSEEGAFAAPGVPLLQITDISKLKFTVNVPEQDLNLFKFNQKYSIRTDAYSNVSILGIATLIGSKANAGNSFPVQFTVHNTPDLKIKSGMFGKVNLGNSEQEIGIVIPASAIVGSSIKPQVYLVKIGKAALQDIAGLKKIQNEVLVSVGLKEGDIIVTNGFINLFDGANVAIK
jgi:RND family efflux transporter MFP subunit